MDTAKMRLIGFLKWLERYTKTDMVYLAQGGFWLGLGQVVSTLSAFLVSIAFANLLPPETYGVYKFVLSITSMILISTLYGMDSAVAQAVAREQDGTLLEAVKVKIKWGALGTLLSLLISLYYYTQGNINLTLAFCIVALFAPFSESFDMYNAFLWGRKLFTTQTIYNIIRRIVYLILLAGILFVTKNIFIILAVYFLAITIPAGFFLLRIIKHHLRNNTVDPEAISYGKHLSAIYIISLILGELDKVLIFHYLGAVDLAVYTIALAPGDQIKGIMKNLNLLAFPQLALKNKDDIKKTIFHKVWILGLTTIGVVFLYICFIPLVFKIFFPKYLTSVFYSQIASLSLIGAVTGGFLYSVLESQKAKKQLYQYNLYSNIFSLVTLFPLVYYFGLMGAVIARILFRSSLFVISAVLVKEM